MLLHFMWIILVIQAKACADKSDGNESEDPRGSKARKILSSSALKNEGEHQQGSSSQTQKFYTFQTIP